MTRIRLVSDIHTEFYNKNEDFHWLPNASVDVLVVAGDLSSGFKRRIKRNLKTLCDKFPHVVYVLGNHDIFHSSIEDRHEKMADLDARIDNLHWLENTRKEIEGVSFAGCTMWFDINKTNLMSGFCDYVYIKDGANTIEVAHENSKVFLQNEVQQGDIVVTHHMPTTKCIDQRWVGSSYNTYFYADMDHIIEDNKPAAWLHGHSHDICNMYVDDTLLLRNPKGYPHENKAGVFDPNFLLDTESDLRTR